ncbi:MAG TPA: hypothetical protein VFV38_53070 [Ktedonobacteraceae bacterium]|nr:hypothetical protein [Ktedonobacteraceae bacterium]
MTEQKQTNDKVMKECMTLEEVRRSVLAEEDGYDVPFSTFTWRHWLEMQAQANQSFSRFLRAIENQRIDVALLVGLEIQEIATRMLVEACTWIGSTPREDQLSK